MYVKFSPRDLNSNPSPPHLTKTYTCGVANIPMVCDSVIKKLIRC